MDNVKELLRSALLLLDNQSSLQYGLGLYMYAVEEFGKAILLRRYITNNNNNNERKYSIPCWILGKGKATLESIVLDNVLKELLKPQIPYLDKIITFYRNLRQVLAGEKLSKPKRKRLCIILSLGINAHNAKLLIGFNNLPHSCGTFSRGIKISTPFTYPKTISISLNRKVSPLTWVTGEFLDTTHIDIRYVTETFTPELLEKVIPDLIEYKLDLTSLNALGLITFADLDLKTACFYMDWDAENKSWKYDIAVDWNRLTECINSLKEKIGQI